MGAPQPAVKNITHGGIVAVRKGVGKPDEQKVRIVLAGQPHNFPVKWAGFIRMFPAAVFTAADGYDFSHTISSFYNSIASIVVLEGGAVNWKSRLSEKTRNHREFQRVKIFRFTENQARIQTKNRGTSGGLPVFFRRGYRASKESQMVSVISVTEPPETVTFSAEQCPPWL